jgi:hypothetical protein
MGRLEADTNGYHLRSDSGSNGLVAKECHRFSAAGLFNFQPGVALELDPDSILKLSFLARFCAGDLLFLVIERKQIPHSASELLTHKTASQRSEG